MRIKVVPLWEGSYGGWEFSWGFLKKTAAVHMETKQFLTAEQICILASMEAFWKKDEHDYIVPIDGFPRSYRQLTDKGVISHWLVTDPKWAAASYIRVRVKCDILSHIPISRLIESLLVETGWVRDWKPETHPDRDEIINHHDIWRTLGVWMEKLPDEEMPEFLAHPHFLVRELAHGCMKQRKGSAYLRGHKRVVDWLLEQVALGRKNPRVREP